MKKVLYITNLPVPYRTEFFNQLSTKCKLDVLYEGLANGSREQNWLNSVDAIYNRIVIDSDFSQSSLKRGSKIISYVINNYAKYDEIIIGCCNTKPQMLLYLTLWLLRKKFSINLDGETFFDDQGIKAKLKRFFICHASKYYIAGDKPMRSAIRAAKLKEDKCTSYYFSSLTEDEVSDHEAKAIKTIRNNVVLIVAQYADYKRLDIALEVAKQLPELIFKFVGTSSRTEEFKQLVAEMGVSNIEIVPFMNKDELEKEYLACKFFLLPSRRECWGLVINEAASYGTPIVSTQGVGAAVEFLQDEYSEFLAHPNDAKSIFEAIKKLQSKDENFMNEYKGYLLNKSREYTIENTVKQHMLGIEE